jgi:hypothetical protein
MRDSKVSKPWRKTVFGAPAGESLSLAFDNCDDCPVIVDTISPVLQCSENQIHMEVTRTCSGEGIGIHKVTVTGHFGDLAFMTDFI